MSRANVSNNEPINKLTEIKNNAAIINSTVVILATLLKLTLSRLSFRIKEEATTGLITKATKREEPKTIINVVGM